MQLATICHDSYKNDKQGERTRPLTRTALPIFSSVVRQRVIDSRQVWVLPNFIRVRSCFSAFSIGSCITQIPTQLCLPPLAHFFNNNHNYNHHQLPLITMARMSTQRTAPSRQKSIYGPGELERLRVPKSVPIKRESSYEDSFYATRQNYMKPTTTEQTPQKTRRRLSLVENRNNLSNERSRRQSIKKFVNNRASDAEDLLTLLLLADSALVVADSIASCQ